MKVAPVNSVLIDVPSPAMVHIIFELSFINEIMTLPSDTLQFSISVDLSESWMNIVLTNSHVIVGWKAWVFYDVIYMEQTKLFPFS